jgi:hypothetical protein
MVSDEVVMGRAWDPKHQAALSAMVAEREAMLADQFRRAEEEQAERRRDCELEGHRYSHVVEQDSKGRVTRRWRNCKCGIEPMRSRYPTLAELAAEWNQRTGDETV